MKFDAIFTNESDKLVYNTIKENKEIIGTFLTKYKYWLDKVKKQYSESDSRLKQFHEMVLDLKIPMIKLSNYRQYYSEDLTIAQENLLSRFSSFVNEIFDKDFYDSVLQPLGDAVDMHMFNMFSDYTGAMLNDRIFNLSRIELRYDSSAILRIDKMLVRMENAYNKYKAKYDNVV